VCLRPGKQDLGRHYRREPFRVIRLIATRSRSPSRFLRTLLPSHGRRVCRVVLTVRPPAPWRNLYSSHPGRPRRREMRLQMLLRSAYTVSLYLVISLQMAKYCSGSPSSSRNGTIVMSIQ
jgi:hypothetical protein